MNMFKTIVMCFLMLVSSTGFAGITADDLGNFNNLTESQKADVVKKIAELQEASPASGPITAEVVQEKMKSWTDIGAGIGMMLVSTAKELGLAANEFAQTPLGKTAIVVGLTYMFGAKIIGVFAWFACWFIFIPAIWLSYNRFAYETIVEKKPTDKKFLWLVPLYETKVTRRDNDSDSNIMAFHCVAAAVFFITGCFMF